jgi:hypothetical protein
MLHVHSAPKTPSPGAITSSSGPKLENVDFKPDELFDPTAIAFGYAAGYITPAPLLPLLPLAATTMTPAFQALSIDVCKPESGADDPRLRLITFAPCATAQSMPCATWNVLPLPLLSSTFTGMIMHAQHTPAPPSPLFVFIATMLDTKVPCQ